MPESRGPIQCSPDLVRGCTCQIILQKKRHSGHVAAEAASKAGCRSLRFFETQCRWAHPSFSPSKHCSKHQRCHRDEQTTVLAGKITKEMTYVARRVRLLVQGLQEPVHTDVGCELSRWQCMC